MKDKQKVQLTISLLVSNSINTIRRCMESLVPLLEAIPSELIVVDTGGTDGSIEIAKEYANEVIPFVWCNDFAKARNTGLKRAKGEWFLYLDDDEWFDDVEEIITFFKTKEYLKYNSATYPIRNYHNKEGRNWTESRCYRMVKITPKTQFISPIHEILTPAPLPEKIFNCFAHHYGYVFENEEERIKHCNRNISLLEEVIKEDKGNQRLRMQLAQEYAVMKNFTKSKKISEENISILRKQEILSQAQITYSGWNMKNVVYTEILQGNKEEAYNKAKIYINYKWINIVTKNNLSHVLTKLAYELEREEDCFYYMEVYLKTYNLLMKDEILRTEETLVDQSESYTKENHFSTLLSGIKASYKVDNKEKQMQYLEELSKDTFFKIGKEDYSIILKCLLHIEDKIQMKKYLDNFMEYDIFRKQLLDVMKEDEMADFVDYIYELLSDYSDKYQELLPYKIIDCHKKNREIKDLLDNYFNEKKNIFYHDIQFLDIFSDKADILNYANQLSLVKWHEIIDDFIQQASWDILQKMREVFSAYKNNLTRISSLKINNYEKILANAMVEVMDFSSIDCLLREYIEIVLNFNLSIYQEEIFLDEREFYLPDNCRFCNKLQMIYEEGLDDLAKAKIIREAVDLYPPLASFCKIYLNKMQEEGRKVTDEFLQLGEMIKKSIRTYIAMGQLENAKMTLTQLEQLMPNDSEILELKKMLL